MADARPDDLADLDLARSEACTTCGPDGRVRLPHTRQRVVCPVCRGTRLVPGPGPVVEVGRG